MIVGEIKNYLRDHGWAVKVPRKLQKHKMAVKRAVESLTQELGRPPTVDEIGEATLLTQAEVFDTFEVAKYGNPLSLDAEYGVGGDRDGYSLMEFLGETDPHFDGLTDRMALTNTISCLDRREKAIIYMKFYVGLSQVEIGKRLHISQMHVSRLQRTALSKLKQDLLR